MIHDPCLFRKLSSPGHDWRPTPGLAADGIFRRLTARDTNGKPSILLASSVCHSCCSIIMIRDRTHPGVDDGVAPNLGNELGVREVRGGWRLAECVGNLIKRFQAVRAGQAIPSPSSATLQPGEARVRCEKIAPKKTCPERRHYLDSVAVDRGALDRDGTMPPRVSPRRTLEE
jgi:hypothetical protein